VDTENPDVIASVFVQRSEIVNILQRHRGTERPSASERMLTRGFIDRFVLYSVSENSIKGEANECGAEQPMVIMNGPCERNEFDSMEALHSLVPSCQREAEQLH
jgi:hypothetical protein